MSSDLAIEALHRAVRACLHAGMTSAEIITETVRAIQEADES